MDRNLYTCVFGSYLNILISFFIIIIIYLLLFIISSLSSDLLKGQ